MKLIDKLTDGKTMRFILLVCCVLFTAAFIFSVVDSHIQREGIRRELGYVEYINDKLRDINRELGSIEYTIRNK